MRYAVALAACLLLVCTGVAAGKGHKPFSCGSTAGNVVSVTPHAKVGKNEVEGSGSLPSCVLVSTKSFHGQLEFTLKQDGVDCTVKPGSRVMVEPSRGVLVSFQHGFTKCSTQTSGDNVYDASSLPLKGDPIFSVTVRGKHVSVHVARGFLEAGTNKVIVGPKQEVTGVGQTSAPAKSLPPADVASLLNSTVAAPAPKLQLSQPLAGTSKTLARILARRQLRVAIEGGSTTGIGVLRFVHSYFAFLSSQWQLRAPRFVVSKGRETPASLLTSRKADVLVAFRVPTKTQSEVLFVDRAQTPKPWSIVTLPDPVFFDSLDRFMQSALDSGAYGTRYKNAFGTDQPAYGVLRPQLFPTPTCTPPPGTDYTTPYNLALTLGSVPSGPYKAGDPVTRIATVTNTGARPLPCVTVHFHLFVDALGDQAVSGDAKGGCHPDQTEQQKKAHELVVSCEIGPLGPKGTPTATATAKLKSTPMSSNPTNVSTETCASVDAQESGGQPERFIGDNGACAQIVYRTKSLVVGAADDSLQASQINPDAAHMDLVPKAGLSALVITERWSPRETAPTTGDADYFRTTVATASKLGIDLYLEVLNDDREKTPRDAAARADFAAYTVALLQAAPGIDHVIVGNEPNNGAFWQPQYEGGRYVAAADYEALLAQTYDAVKALGRPVVVLGGALAPRGTDRYQGEKKRNSRSPVQFIADLGAAYASDAAGRQAPIMDAFALHATPLQPADLPLKPLPAKSKQLGIADYPKLVQSLGAAFPAPGPQLGATLPIYYTEYGVETTTPKGAADYEGKETSTIRCGKKTCSAAVDPQQQAVAYEQAIALAACQPTVAGFFIFHLVDDKKLNQWQSGLYQRGTDGPVAKSSLADVRTAAIAARDDPVTSCAVAPATH